jgi:hypothetical protein
MANRRLSMRKIKEVLRLHQEIGLSERQIAKSCDISRSTVKEYLHRAQRAGLNWPLPSDLDDAQLENLLFPLIQPIAPEKSGMPPLDYLYQGEHFGDVDSYGALCLKRSPMTTASFS